MLYNGFNLKGVSELFLFLFSDNVLRMNTDNIVIGAFHGQSAAQRFNSRHIGVGVVFQIHRKVAGHKEGVETIQHIAELGILLFETFLLFPAVKKQNKNI